MQDGKLKDIQGLRAAAFILIFLNHSYSLFTSHQVFDFGARGVEIFFVLSGYLMAYHYSDRDITPTLNFSVKYVLNKTKKFYLLHLLTFFAMSLFLVYQHYFHGQGYLGGIIGFVRDAILNLSLLKSWYYPSAFSFNGVSWFLSTILFIYFLFPKTIWVMKNKINDKIGLAFILLICLKYIGDTLFYNMRICIYPGFHPYTNPAYRYIDFLLGYLGYVILKSTKIKENLWYINIYQIFIIALYLTCCFCFDGKWIPAPYVVMTILLIHVCSLKERGILDWLFGNALMTHLGDISLELFLLNQVVIEIFKGKINHFVNDGKLTAFLLFILTIITAELYHRISKHIVKRL
jgi:peptidoglycan/LPS O-acetylase OafA/YrhL